jgi:hypothetical protein
VTRTGSVESGAAGCVSSRGGSGLRTYTYATYACDENQVDAGTEEFSGTNAIDALMRAKRGKRPREKRAS